MQSSLPIPNEGLRVTEWRHTLAGRIAVAISATLFVAICARLSVPLWFTPVPLSLQNFAVLLVGLALGPVDGFAAMALYLAEGASGIPVFSPQGLGGIAQLLGPTGGYLLSYPLVAFLMGVAARANMRRTRRIAACIVAGIAATVVLLSVGSAWLAHELHLTAAMAFRMGALPFLPGEAVKIAAAAGIYTSASRLVRN